MSVWAWHPGIVHTKQGHPGSKHPEVCHVPSPMPHAVHAEQRSWTLVDVAIHTDVYAVQSQCGMQDTPRKVQLPRLGGGVMQDRRRVLDALCTEAG